jgi:hypothetical protein
VTELHNTDGVPRVEDLMVGVIGNLVDKERPSASIGFAANPMRYRPTVDLTEVHSLTDFLRNTKSHLSRMKRSKRPLVLTVNGRAELVVQDARSFQALLELADRAEAIEGIRRGLESMARGEGRPVEQVLEHLRKKDKIPRRT